MVNLYLYFDKNGILKETYQETSGSFRQGSNLENTIFTYFESVSESEINNDRIKATITFKKANNDLSLEYDFTNNQVRKAIPYSETKDTTYFKDFKKYDFFYYSLTSNDLAVNGLLIATIRTIIKDSGTILANGLLTLNVEESVLKVDNNISQSQYDYLLSLIGNSSTWLSDKLVRTFEVMPADLTEYENYVIYDKNAKNWYLIKNNEAIYLDDFKSNIKFVENLDFMVQDLELYKNKVIFVNETGNFYQVNHEGTSYEKLTSILSTSETTALLNALKVVVFDEMDIQKEDIANDIKNKYYDKIQVDNKLTNYDNKEQVNTKITTATNGLLYDFRYNETTHEMSFAVKGQTERVGIDLDLESLIKDIDVVGDNMVLHLENGTTKEIPLNTLLVGVVKFVNNKAPDNSGKVVLTIDDIPSIQASINATETRMQNYINSQLDEKQDVIADTGWQELTLTNAGFSGELFVRRIGIQVYVIGSVTKDTIVDAALCIMPSLFKVGAELRENVINYRDGTAQSKLGTLVFYKSGTFYVTSDVGITTNINTNYTIKE